MKNETTKYKILLVEDEYDAYELLASFFSENGLEIIRQDKSSFVDSYQEAVRLCQMMAPDLAILDIKLKGNSKDGIDLAYWLKEQFNIPIIFVSGHPNPEYAERLVGMAEVQFISKVATRAELKGLWFNVQRILPTETEGKFFKVRNIPTSYFLTKGNNIETFDREYGRHNAIDQFIRYRMIKEVFVLEEIWGRNCIAMINANGNHYHRMGMSLSKLEKEMPDQFMSINSNTMVNSDWIDRSSIGEDTFYIGDKWYKVSKDFKGAERALAILKRLRDSSRPKA